MLSVLAPARLDDANTLRLPCSAPAVLTVDSADDVSEAIDWCRNRALRLLPLGEGSNVVLPPRLRRAVLRSADAGRRVVEDRGEAVTLRVGAALHWHTLVSDCLAEGLHGLENLALIPGSTGAAPVQNIGAYGVEIASFVVAVHGVHLDTSRPESLRPADCDFAYRDSVFKGRLRDRFLITSVDLRLSRTPHPVADYPALAARLAAAGLAATARNVYDTVVALRRERLPDPRELPNAGSFFKNPIVSAAQAEALAARYPSLPVHAQDGGRAKLSAAWMIDACGFRGTRQGGAAVHGDHALVLLNLGGGQNDLLELARRIRDAVEARFDVALEIEPTLYADD
jgi:UDP-N-acetylmuramate dehydrogenase